MEQIDTALGTITFDFYGEQVTTDVEVAGRYQDGTTAIRLVDTSDGMPFCTLTNCVPGTYLASDEVLVKTYNENAVVREPLLAAGLFSDTGRRIRSGFVSLEIWTIGNQPTATAA